MQSYKIRRISARGEQFFYGVTIPVHLSEKWKDIYVTIKETGNSLILGSVTGGTEEAIVYGR